MVDTLTPPVDPSYSSTGETQYKVIRADFGDGYSQRVPDGLNTVRRAFNLSFENMTATQADTLQAFFDAKNGATPFYYTLPLESTPVLWITKDSPQKSYQGPDSITLQVKIEQVFDLV